MPLTHRLQQTMLSGLGVAGSVLAAVLVTFTIVSGIVAYRWTSAETSSPATGALVLDPLRVDARSDGPLVLARPAGARTSRSSGSRPAGARATGASATVAGSGRGRAEPSRAPKGTGAGSDGAQDAAPATAGPAAPRPSRGPVADAIDGTSQAVSATTGSLSRRLDAVATGLQTTAAQTRAAVREAVSRTNSLLAHLRGARPAG